MNRLIRVDRLPPGFVLSTHKGPVDHFALISDNRSGGILRVIGTSPGTYGVAEIPYWSFSRGQMVHAHGYPGDLPPEEVMARARSIVGMNYDWLVANCEHFVSYCHGLEPESPQLQKWLSFGALALGVLALARAA